MTCKDCIHYDNKIQETVGRVEFHICSFPDKLIEWKWVKNIDKPCDEFVSKDGTFYEGTEHCPKCGKPVDKWGLCNECECVGNALDALDKMRDATSEELEGISNYIRSISKPTGYSFYDSWESVTNE